MKIIKGKFMIVGWDFLSPKESEIQKNLKPGNILSLEIDLNNEYDKYAIKILYNKVKVGWWPENDYMKPIIFEYLKSGYKIEPEIIDIFPFYAKYSFTLNPEDEISKEELNELIDKIKENLKLKKELKEANKKLKEIQSTSPKTGCLGVILFIIFLSLLIL